MKRNEIAKRIDHTQLKPNVPLEQIELICLEARQYGFATVAIHPAYIADAVKYLKGSDVGIVAALAFPYGSLSAEMKAFEIADALRAGATECDFVINVGALRSGDYDALKREGEACRAACPNHILKAILEVCLLDDEQIAKACGIYAACGVDFVKTSTGFMQPPTPRVVKLMHDAVAGTGVKVKAAGGIRNAADAKAMIEAGAVRLGTSAGVSIVESWVEE